MQELYVHIGWPLYRKYGHAFEVSICFLLILLFDSSDFFG